MNLSRETKLELMAWADGELPDDMMQRIGLLVDHNEDARSFVDDLRSANLGEWVKLAMNAKLERAPSVTDGVMARLGAEQTTTTTLPSLRRRHDQRRTRAIAISIGSGLAIAAGVVMVLRAAALSGGGQAPIALNESPSASVADPSAPSPAGTPLAPAAHGVEVNDIDSLSRGISVFEIPLRAASANASKSWVGSSVVIWIDDDRNDR